MNHLIQRAKQVAFGAVIVGIQSFAQAHAQSQPVTLVIDIDNGVTYREDVFEASKFATDPGPTNPIPSKPFVQVISMGDIVTVNGKPAKGLWMFTGIGMNFNPDAAPGQTIADVIEGGFADCKIEILQADGTFVGKLSDGGLGSSHVLTGGTGAFLGARGQQTMGLPSPTPRPFRAASFSEGPANRRILGGGTSRQIIYLYPMARPEIEVTPNGPSVFHGNDFSLVTQAKPAHAGEVLIVRAAGLGPTRPNLEPPGSRAFSADPLEEVNSPVEMTLNGNNAQVVNKFGWPGETGLYRVDFQVPNNATPGIAAIQLTVAWIPGSAVKIPIR